MRMRLAGLLAMVCCALTTFVYAQEVADRPANAEAEEQRELEEVRREEEEEAFHHRREQQAWKQERKMRMALMQEVTVDFDATPLVDVVKYFSDTGGLNVVLHQATRQGNPAVDLRLKKVRLELVLEVLCRSLDLGFDVMGNVIYIGPRPKEEANAEEREAAKIRIPLGRGGNVEFALTYEELPPERRRELAEQMLEGVEQQAERMRDMQQRQQRMQQQRQGGDNNAERNVHRRRRADPPNEPEGKAGKQEIF